MLVNSSNTAVLASSDINLMDLAFVADEISGGKRNLIIHSRGGSAVTIVAAPRILLGRQVTTVGVGVVCSAALNLFLCGVRRVATPDTIFMFHHTRYPFEERWVTANEAQQLARIASLVDMPDREARFHGIYCTLAMVDSWVARLIASRTALDFSRVRQLMEGGDTTLSAKEALLYRFIDEIVPESSLIPN